MSIVVGVDVGGTFTDIVLYDEDTRSCSVAKVLSTPDDQSKGLLTGLQSLKIPLSRIGAIVHGTTVATNALLERKGTQLALVATRGFRDIAELHTRERPNLYGLRGTFSPLVSRDLRFEVSERVDTHGTVLSGLNLDEMRAVAAQIKSQGVGGIVVTFLNCFANPANELAARRILQEYFPSEKISLSSEVLPTIGEYERTSTTIINSYVRPLVGGYLDSLEERLSGSGYSNGVLVVQSNGGVVGSPVAARTPVNTILSGPAAGVIAGSYISQQAGFDRCITCDMGGTSFDVCLVDGTPTMANRKQLDFGITAGLSVIDITTVGAGGGSLAHVDARGFLAVGPQSAGAMPGPACYGRGGTQPTVTDANLVLGRLNPQLKPGTDAALTLDIAKARASVDELGRRLGMDSIRTAEAILAVANRRMASSIRLVSVERGYDPRDFVLIVFGGAGPLHATALMRELGATKALIPYFPGLGCALGCIMADLKHEFSAFIDRRVADIKTAELVAIAQGHAREGRQMLERDRAKIEKAMVVVEADMAYEGQLNSVRVGLSLDALDADSVIRSFRREYQKLYRRLLDPLPVRIVNLRTSVIGMRPKVDLRDLMHRGEIHDAPAETRHVYFNGEFAPTPVYRRASLAAGTILHGPAIIESNDTTIMVDPGVIATTDEWGNLLLENRQ